MRNTKYYDNIYFFRFNFGISFINIKPAIKLNKIAKITILELSRYSPMPPIIKGIIIINDTVAANYCDITINVRIRQSPIEINIAKTIMEALLPK